MKRVIGCVAAALLLQGCASREAVVPDRVPERVMTLGTPTVTYKPPQPLVQVERPAGEVIIEATPPQVKFNTRQAVIPAMLEQTRWELRKVAGNPVAASPAGQEPYLKLAQGRVDGFSGCNLFNGNYRRDVNNRLRFVAVKGSVLKCPGREAVEQGMVQALMQVRSWAISSDQSLFFLNATGQELAVFAPVYPAP